MKFKNQDGEPQTIIPIEVIGDPGLNFKTCKGQASWMAGHKAH